MTSLRALFLLPIALTSAWQAVGAAPPHIEGRSGEPILVLPAPMEAALNNFDPEFKIRRLTDYPPYMWRSGCTWSPDCGRNLYRLRPREAPFAVVGDFNGDGILDAVMDGNSGQTGRRIVLLSSGQRFSASEIDVLGPVPSTDIEFYRSKQGAGRDWELGIDVGLSLAKPATYRAPYEPQPLVLTTDGFVVSYFEKAATLYYFAQR
jgi:hypothetical protein